MLRTFSHFVSYWFHVIWYVRSVIFTILAIVVIGAVAIALVEKLPFGEALYFSFVTGLTIGYGDIVVKTALGQFVADPHWVHWHPLYRFSDCSSNRGDSKNLPQKLRERREQVHW